ncbi:hypothetical protein COEREDRAFT_7897 [Coemansia reversa NRRL 1564]|uniref:FYVE-type domain-containing protein n=1 Tax=Coemansia reversa (strain ATCC 12441 / NRRL 1564) TaxID=763665 RepID=A0A2G5BDP0_COERN|nr:hypothetical protein COEREDRAFT_7897 [Coemansia reversa NRRL 1564]|eukprot:PIA17134.1 hypothetical protein COEREDRAFT_7897 [Coemansia reversa NRRL 1564]
MTSKQRQNSTGKAKATGDTLPARSSLGLYRCSGDGVEQSSEAGEASEFRGVDKPRNETEVSKETEKPKKCDEPRKENKRSGRRQSTDTMRTMRSLDRQYGRRRRLNSEQLTQVATTEGNTAVARRGDTRGLFAPLCQAATETAVAEGSAAAGPTQLTRQLVAMAGRLAGQSGGVRARASMPLINGVRRAPQRTRSQAATRPARDELSGALTMKAVEIRGGRIVLDDPSSSEDSDACYASAAGVTQRPSIGSSVCSAIGDDALRRRWYTRRCLGIRQPFSSVHRLAKAEHDSSEPFSLLNDMRRVVHEARVRVLMDTGPGAITSLIEDADSGVAADVLLCTDAIVVCAPDSKSLQPLRAMEFGDGLAVRFGEATQTALIYADECNMELAFPQGGAREWVERVVQARTRYATTMQDLRLDEEDYVDRPPLPLLLRGRCSISGTLPTAGSVSAAGEPRRLRNAAQGGVYWVPDAETSVCMVCRTTAFSMMVRRHHCRACGLVICYRCSAVDAARRRLCLRCSTLYRPAVTIGSASVSGSLAPRSKPSVMSLRSRAAEYLPSVRGSSVHTAEGHPATAAPDMSFATDTPTVTAPDPDAQSVPVGRRKPDRHARRPISTLFGVQDTQEL